MANPLVPQGTLNRLLNSITFVSNPGLNITASYLVKEQTTMNFDGVATTPIDTATGYVPSPEPYQRITLACHLVKSMALVQAWKNQIEFSTLIGNFVVWPDVPPGIGLQPYQISSGVISTVNPIRMDGTSADWALMLHGLYYINSSIWNT